MLRKQFTFLAALFLSFLIGSCRKGEIPIQDVSTSVNLTGDQKVLVDKIRQTSKILSEILVDDKLKDGFLKYISETDKNNSESIRMKYLLADDLNQNTTSNVSSEFLQLFKEKFKQAHVKFISKKSDQAITISGDEINETYDDVEVYFPYRDEPIIQERIQGSRPSITYVDDDAGEMNSKTGTLKSWDIGDPSDRSDDQWVYSSEIVDDDYAAQYPTFIVRPLSNESNLPAQTPSTNLRVSLGWVRVSEQYDSFFGGIFGGNGGGSELRFYRVKGYVNASQQNDVAFETVISHNVNRRDIRRNNYVRIYAIWDPSWETDQTEQVFGCYEEDKQGDKVISGTVKYKEFVNLSYSQTIKSQNEVIGSFTFNRGAFLNENSTDLGHGFREDFPIRAFSSSVYITTPHATF